MEELKKILLSEVEEFREIGHKFLKKEVSLLEFKGKSGGMGVYAERGAETFMIRFRIPSGVTNLKELKLLYEFAKKCNIEDIHLTTRQAIQLHGLSIDEACDLMIEGIKNDLYTRGSGGNYPRNVALSPLSGVCETEVFDPTGYALVVGNYFLKNVRTYNLPRKIKVSFSNSSKDTARAKVQDLGFIAVKVDNKNYFEAYVAGGLGMNPKTGIKLDGLIDPKDTLYYVEAMIKLFVQEGDYKNKAKARIRYIPERMGEENFIKLYKDLVEKEKRKGNMDVLVEETKLINKKGIETSIKNHRLIEQKTKGLYSVYVHPIGGILKLKDLNKIINILEKYEDIQVMLSMNEGLYLKNLNGKEAEKVMEITSTMGGDTYLEHSVSCIGVPTCQIGICNSQKLLKDILAYYEDKGEKSDALPKINISGCHNSCAVHEIAKIGFTGRKKRIDGEAKNVFTLFLNGVCEADKVSLGDEIGDMLPERIPTFLYELGGALERHGLNFSDYYKEKQEEMKLLVNKYLV